MEFLKFENVFVALALRVSVGMKKIHEWSDDAKLIVSVGSMILKNHVGCFLGDH